MKKFMSVLLSAALVIGVSSCGSAGNSTQTAETVTEQVVDARPLGEMRGLSAKELISEMSSGWNLGNTMDAIGGETAWGNPVTTKEMIDEVKKAGFDTIRIPTTWHKNMGEAPDYTVSEEWMNRVEEIVGYALENDMYVILNTHHEGSWIKPQYEGLDDVKAQLKALWNQIALRFIDYGDHLIFEGLNEPRIEGGKNEWNGGTKEGRECLNQLNSLFIETVRATGGNNEKRTLLITSFAASATETAIKDVEIPEDKYVGVSIHAYTPYRFTYDSKGESWNATVFDESCENEIASLFALLNEYFISKDVPVIITEYGSVWKYQGAVDLTMNTAEVEKWAEFYVSEADKYGIPCVWWDNGYYYSGNELFGIFNRRELNWYVPDLVKIITKQNG